MKEWLAPADGNNGCAKVTEAVNSREHLIGGHGLGEIVEFVAVGAGEVAAARGDDVCKERVAGGEEPLHDHAAISQHAMPGEELAPDFRSKSHDRLNP